MRRYTNRALLISLGLHLILVLTIVPLLRNDSSESKDSVSLVLLEAQPIQQVQKRVFRQRHPPDAPSQSHESINPFTRFVNTYDAGPRSQSRGSP